MSNQPKHDTLILYGIGLLIVVSFCVLFWLTMNVQISSGIRWFRVGQLQIISLFTDQYDSLIVKLKQFPPDQITPFYILKMTELTNGMLRWPVVVILMAMSTFCFLRKAQHPFSRKFDLEGIIKEQAAAFPVTAPITRYNPLTGNFRTQGSPVPAKLPPFAEALAPEEWVTQNDIPLTDTGIDVDAARRAFAKQLGGRWQGADALPMYAKALFVAFSMKANGMRTQSDEFLGEVAKCWLPGRPMTLTPALRKEIAEKMRDPKFGRITEKVAAQHAFNTPALIRCLQVAREQGGVLAPAQFLWLRAVDRHLWYPLNNFGRGAVHAEAAGAMAHYRAEKAAGKPIPNPQVEPAIEGLNQYLKENFITNFPAKEY